MKIIIVTGMSGAGKSSAINYLEDIGYYCIDNMPPEMLLSFARFIIGSDKLITKIAISVDIRSGELFLKFEDCVNALRAPDVELSVLYLDADDDTLVKRYKETRRKHPLDDEAFGNLYKAISLEREETERAKEMSDFYIDTTDFKMADFHAKMAEFFTDKGTRMAISVISFGFKYGIPKDADLVFDVRCLPNPFYVPELKNKCGLDDEVYNYVMSFSESNEVFKKIYDLVSFMIPMYEKEGRSRLVIAFGCTGGRHRSVSFARRMADALSADKLSVRVEHRSLEQKT
ncbi:MAG: RNase adapter RapZ [Oscillospiraceae bacterium]|nr:RNase adapter RapZ [Oscillospiraceae bacterium]